MRIDSLSAKFVSGLLAASYLFSATLGYGQGTPLSLPRPGSMVMPSKGYAPVMLKGIVIDPLNPLSYEFIIDTGHSWVEGQALELEAERLIKYFLASLTVPEDELWVNLSPFENERIASEAFGRTEMGRDLLGQDYVLKQLTSSLMYPESELGRTFWSKVYQKAHDRFGTTSIPVNTFNKVWIVPDEAVVYEGGNAAVVLKSRLKVMLEEDYLALREDPRLRAAVERAKENQEEEINALGSQIVREIIIPEIEKEVNEGKNFANLRQIYHAMILAAWFKNTLRESLLGQVYVDQNKVMGVDADDPQIKEKIYQQYLDAYTRGVYNYIREDIDPVTQDVIPRKYFSGGFTTRDAEGRNLGKKVSSSALRGPAPDVVPEGRVFSVRASVVEANPRNLMRQIRRITGAVLLGASGIFMGNADAVTPETAQIYVNNQAAYNRSLTDDQARAEIDINMNKMLSTMKAEQRATRALAPWIQRALRLSDTFDNFSQAIRTVLAVEQNPARRAALERDVLQAVYHFVKTNSVFDLYGQVMDDANVGNYRNFIVSNPNYGKRTIVCQTITEFNLALLVYEFGFDAARVTAVDVPVNYQGRDMSADGGHTANLIKLADGSVTMFDVVQGNDRNRGLDVIHQRIVVKGERDGKTVDVPSANEMQTRLRNESGNTVEELVAYQEFEREFLKEINNLIQRERVTSRLILSGNLQGALEEYRAIKSELDGIYERSVLQRRFLLQRVNQNYNALADVINSNIQVLETRLRQQPPPQPTVERGSAPVVATDNVGGIDLNPATLNLQIKRDPNGVPLPLAQQSLSGMEIDGFYPVIINIAPISNPAVIFKGK